MPQPSELDLFVIGAFAVMTGVCLYAFGIDPFSFKGVIRLAGSAILAGATAKLAVEYVHARRHWRTVLNTRSPR